MVKNKQYPLPLLGNGRISKKVILLLIVTIICLSILFIPTLVSSDGIYMNEVQAGAAALDDQNKYIEEIVNQHCKELEEQGYTNVTFEALPMLQQIRVNKFTEEDIKNSILNNFVFYADYITVTVDKEIYYFKSSQESDNFIRTIKKYDKTKLTTSTVKEIIGAETSQEVLDKKISEKRVIAEKRKAQQKKKKQISSPQIVSTGVVSDNVIINYALQFVGNPYVYGGTSLTHGADCSGFVQSIYKHFGISLPRGARGQATVGTKVSWDALQPGDLIFYSGNGGQSITHVAIYIGNAQIVHASTSKGGIKVASANIMVKMTARRVI